MSLPAHAYLCRLAPIFESKRSGYRNRKAPLRSKLRVVPEHVISRTRASFLPRGADADAFFITIGKTEHTPGVAVHDPDEIGQDAPDLSGVQRKLGRSAREFANSLDHSFAVRCHPGSQFT